MSARAELSTLWLRACFSVGLLLSSGGGEVIGGYVTVVLRRREKLLVDCVFSGVVEGGGWLRFSLRRILRPNGVFLPLVTRMATPWDTPLREFPGTSGLGSILKTTGLVARDQSRSSPASTLQRRRPWRPGKVLVCEGCRRVRGVS